MDKLCRRGYTIGTSIVDFLSSLGYCFLTHLQADGLYTFSVHYVCAFTGIDCLFESKDSYTKDEVGECATNKMITLC